MQPVPLDLGKNIGNGGQDDQWSQKGMKAAEQHNHSHDRKHNTENVRNQANKIHGDVKRRVLQDGAAVMKCGSVKIRQALEPDSSKNNLPMDVFCCRFG